MGKDKVYGFMKGNKGISYSIKHLAEELGMHGSQVRKHINKMLEWPRIYPHIRKHYVRRSNKLQHKHIIHYVFLE